MAYDKVTPSRRRGSFRRLRSAERASSTSGDGFGRQTNGISNAFTRQELPNPDDIQDAIWMSEVAPGARRQLRIVPADCIVFDSDKD